VVKASEESRITEEDKKLLANFVSFDSNYNSYKILNLMILMHIMIDNSKSISN